MKKLDAGDPETESRDLVADNIEQLKQLFPEAFTEGKIDFDVLRQLLGGSVEEREEKYGLNWHGKRQARQIALTPSLGTLRPCPEESVDWDTTQNLMIEGDNLEVLKLLQKSYAGKVKMIYIDPPYNTGKDFVYPDDLRDNTRNYLQLTGQQEGGLNTTTNKQASGRFHTDWLKMLYPRIKLSRSLLASDGVIFVSIDDEEAGNLREVLDELYGEENFLGTIVWRTATDNNPTQIATDHEYVLAYAKLRDALDDWEMPSVKGAVISEQYQRLRASLGNDPGAIQAALRSWIRKAVEAGDVELDGVSHYDYVDDRGVFYPGNSSNPRPGGYTFDIAHPVTGETCSKPDNGYRWPLATFQSADARGDVHWGDDHTSVPKIKKRLETATALLKSSYYEDNRGSTKELTALMGAKVFDNPKSPRLIRRLIGFASSIDGIVLDFFAGSGTTGHAVLAQNAADGGKRQYVLVQFPERLDLERREQKVAAKYCDSIRKPRNIAEITKERLRRAAKKVQEDNPLFAGDLGFRSFRFDSSNISTWESRGGDFEQTLLDSVEHIKTDRADLDVLFELLLKRGLDLRAPIETRRLAKKQVSAIAHGALMACLSNEIRSKEVEPVASGIADWHKTLGAAGEAPIIFRDSAFENDAAKANMAAILEQHGLTNVITL